MRSKWIHYNVHCVACGVKVSASVRKRNEPEVEHLCFNCPDPGTPENRKVPKKGYEPETVVLELLTGRLPMPQGDIACAQIEDAIDDVLFDMEWR